MLKKSLIFAGAVAATSMLAACGDGEVDNLDKAPDDVTSQTAVSDALSKDGYNIDLDESSAEGVLISQEEFEKDNWVGSEEDPEILINENTGEAMFEGAVYGALAAVLASKLYNSGGTDKSSTAVSSSVKKDNSPSAFSGGSYKSSDMSKVTGSTVKIDKPADAKIKTKGSSSMGKGGVSSGGKGGGAS